MKILFPAILMATLPLIQNSETSGRIRCNECGVSRPVFADANGYFFIIGDDAPRKVYTGAVAGK